MQTRDDAYSRHDSGIRQEVNRDVPIEHLKQLKDSYNAKVVVTQAEAMEIKENTRTQTKGTEFLTEWRNSIAASKEEGIAITTKKNKFKYSKFRGNDVAHYSSAEEDASIHKGP